MKPISTQLTTDNFLCKQKMNLYSTEILHSYQDVDFFNKDSIDLSLHIQPSSPLVKSDFSPSSFLDSPIFNDSSATDKAYYDTCSLSPKSSFASQAHSMSVVSSGSMVTIDNESQSEFSIFSSPTIFERRSLPAKLHKENQICRVPSFDLQPKEVKRIGKKTWIKRIFKMFNKTDNKQQPDKHPVWYCQYSKNPNPCFENYYKNQPINIVS